MIPFLIGVATVAGLVLLVLLYWSMLESLFPEKLNTNEVFIVTTGDLWKIRMCRYRKGRTGGQPVLLVHGANANQYNFTVPDGASLVDYLVERGYDCWTVDLRGCRSSVAPFERTRNDVTTDDFLNDDIPTALRFIQQETGYARVHYVGHSMGGMLLYAYTQKYGGDAIASGVTLAAPLGFEGLSARRSSLLIKLACLYPPLSGAVIRGLVPFFSALRLSTRLFPTNMRNVARTINSSHFFRMLEDPLPGVLKDFSRWVHFPGWRMDQGNLNVLDGLKDLDFPLFALYAPLDPLIPLAKATEFFDALPSADKRMLVCSKEKGFKNDYNHCDIAFAHDGAREVYGPIARWLETHSSRERMPVDVPDVPTGYQAPLRAVDRADILSGGSYAHLAGAEPATAEAPAPQPKKKATAKKKKAGAPKKKATAPKKNAAAPKKSPAKQKAPESNAAKNVDGKNAAAAPPAGKASRKAPAREKKGGPNLAAASAALQSLGQTPIRTGNDGGPSIRVWARTAPKAATSPDGAVETPKSVLQALSDASNVLHELKDKRK